MTTINDFSGVSDVGIHKPAKFGVGAKFAVLCASAMINFLAITIPLAALLIYDRVLPNGVVQTLGVLAFGVVVVILIDMSLRLARNAIVARAGAGEEHFQRCSIVEHLLSGRCPAQGEISPAHLSATLTAASTLREYRHLQLQAVVDIPFGLAFLVFLATINGWLALIPASVCIFFALVTYIVAFSRERTARDLQESEGAKRAFADKIFDNLHLVKTLGAEIPVIDNFVRRQLRRSDAMRSSGAGAMLVRDMHVVFSQVLIGSVVIASALAVMNGDLSFGGLAACTLLAGRALEPLQTGFQLISQSRLHRIARAEVDRMLDESAPWEPIAASTAEKLWSTPPEIVIRNMSAHSDDGLEPPLLGVDMRIQPGEAVAISADRGQGKTAFVRALLGLTPITGTVSFGGIFIDRTTADLLRRNITYIARDADLRSGSIVDVLTDGDDEAYADVRYLSHMMGLDDAIKRIPSGYDTILSPDAETLPAGILQQLAIVRGLAKTNKVILLDEATFALDAGAEMRLARILTSLKQEATMILLTDRSSLCALADRRLRLIDGQIRPIEQDGA